MDYVIFSDLDGTLLDHYTYSFEAATEALTLIRKKGLPLVICSSKAGAELEAIRKRLRNKDPFISENGGLIFIPRHYFDISKQYLRIKIKGHKDYELIKMGISRILLCKVLRLIEKGLHIQIEGISEMSVQRLMEITSLDRPQALRARKRMVSEPFLVHGGERERKLVKNEIIKRGFQYSEGGRFCHILGENDKGKAVQILTRLYKKRFPCIKTIGIGNSVNDLPMLKRVDLPVLVKKDNGSYENRIRINGLLLADGIGPIGWNQAIIRLLKDEAG